jgi:hypothetical protein
MLFFSHSHIMPAIISIHAQFPKVIVLNTKLDLNPNNWEWKECLAFPVSTLNNLGFSLKPFKWMRYATGIVVGARGDLSTERNSPNPIPIDYNSSLSAIFINLYYHTSNHEKCLIFLIDPNLTETRTETSSQMSTCRDDFYCNVEDRDGSCML